MTIRRMALSDADLAAYVSVFGTVTPDETPDPVQIRWRDERYPDGAWFLAETRGSDVVGAASVGRASMYDPSYDAFWAEVAVPPEARRHGVGSALLAACSAHARAHGKASLIAAAREDRPDGIAFLEHRGFAVVDRAKIVRLDLAGLEVPQVRPPAGVRIVTLGERPDLVEAVYAVAIETYQDIPGDEPMYAGSLDEFRQRDVDRPGIARDAFLVALDEDGRAVGFASLLLEGGRPGVGVHDMTAVVCSHRGRGLATTLKQATIGWAIGAGLTALEAGNDEANTPMRAVNHRLGYRPLPDWLLLRGPLFGGIMTP